MKRLMLLLITGLIALSLSGCSIISNYSSQISNQASSVQAEIVDGVTENGWFSIERQYNLNGRLGISYFSFTYVFSNDGKLTITNLGTEESQEGTYKINGQIIVVTHDDDTVEYFDYLEDVLVISLIYTVEDNTYELGYLCATRDNVAVSQRSKSTLGYHVILNVDQGDLPAVLTGDAKSKGKYFVIYKNGTIKTSSKGEITYTYINADQIIGFDTAEAGDKIVQIAIGTNKLYNAVLHVHKVSDDN